MAIEDAGAWSARMRADWDERAERDAQGAIYTRDRAEDEADFDRSGQANFNQLLRPYLPVLLGGRPARSAQVVEIGCGIGRMTRWLAASFGEVDALDVSPKMIARARERLAGVGNVRLHVNSGAELSAVPDGVADLVFSYIVFQHIPAQEVVARYVAEAARVLKPGGVFKFQVNGDWRAEAGTPDTWEGVRFREEEVDGMLRGAGLEPWAKEGIGTQYFVVTAGRGRAPGEGGVRTYVFPGEAWAEAQLEEGWGKAVESSWRPLARQAGARLARPAGEGARFFIGLYVWPGERARERSLAVESSNACFVVRLEGPGDHYLELPFEGEGAEAGAVRLTLRHDCDRAPAVRCFGLYRPCPTMR